MCVGPGAVCGTSDTCCTGACTLGHCPLDMCVSNGGTCAKAGDCCSNNCSGTTCAAVPGATCTTEGNSCTAPSECCSQTCTGNRCVPAGGTLGCHATGDICFSGADCCSSLCTGASGTTPGTCSALASFGSGGCMLDGEPCSSGTNCCSRVCAAIPGGGNVCQLAGGCRVAGDVCHDAKDCCGGGGTMGAGAGEVACNIIPGTNPPLGTCSNPSGEDPEGDICGQDVNARHDCIDCAPPKINCCKLDNLGVPRCYGTPSGGHCPTGYDGTAGCCIAAGQVCTFSSECCSGNPCLPDSSGILRCSTQTCVAAGGVCTATGDCCTGLECVVPIGQPSGTCKNPTPPPSAADGGVSPGPDGGTCALGGQDCGDSVPCCGGFVCDAFGGGSRCPPGGTNCTCYRLIM
jgi:hypothetical protein